MAPQYPTWCWYFDLNEWTWCPVMDWHPIMQDSQCLRSMFQITHNSEDKMVTGDWMDGWLDGWINSWMDRWLKDSWID